MAHLLKTKAESAGTVEYTDCISAEEQGPIPMNVLIDSHLSDDVAPVLELLGMWCIRL